MDELFTVTDLKEYFVCPRILYYHACLPDIRPITHKMEIGKRRHRQEPQRSSRRNYDIPDIVARHYHVSLKSEVLGLSGQADEVIHTSSTRIPVEYKFSRKASQHFKLQVTAYAMLLEELYDVTVSYGILYLMQAKRHESVKITRGNRRKIQQALEDMHHIARSQCYPPPTKARHLCPECKFRRFCNDLS